MTVNLLDHGLLNGFWTFLMIIGLCFIIPPFLLLKWTHTIIRRCFYRGDDMAGKVVLITGASSGIGEHMAYEYARKKASLVLVARRESRLREVGERARQLGSPDVLLVPGDVSKIDDCKKFVDEAIKHFARLDHLVNNAGIGSVCPIEDATDIGKFTTVMDVNFWGCVYPTYFALPHLKRSKGTIVINSSGSGVINAPNASFYNASKAALISFYETLRVELAPSIKITIVILGFVDSEMTQGKFFSKEGTLEVNKQLRQEVIQWFPVMSTEPCAKAIVEGACRGKRCVIEPKCVRMLSMLMYFCPEAVEWYFQTFYLARGKNIHKIVSLAPNNRTLI